MENKYNLPEILNKSRRPRDEMGREIPKTPLFKGLDGRDYENLAELTRANDRWARQHKQQCGKRREY